MRKLLNLIGIDWYALGDKVLFVDVSGTVCCGYIRERAEHNEKGSCYMFTTVTYEIELCGSNARSWIKESQLIKRVR